MDLGSAVMSAEMAAEMVDDVRVLLCEAPLVEGAVAAAARARTGASLEEVAGEARAALGMKAAQLGVERSFRGRRLHRRSTAAIELRLEVPNRLGLHARPAARFVETASRVRRGVTVADETTGRGPADARSLSALITLAVRQGAHDPPATRAAPRPPRRSPPCASSRTPASATTTAPPLRPRLPHHRQRPNHHPSPPAPSSRASPPPPESSSPPPASPQSGLTPRWV